LEKWSDLKFGMFIHFGVYAMLAGKWMGENVPGLAEWMPCRKKIPLAEYEHNAKTSKPVKWEPEIVVNSMSTSKVAPLSIPKPPLSLTLLKAISERWRKI
jgi:hypothetical protein